MHCVSCTGQSPGHALYPITALISHSCVCNSKTLLLTDYTNECRATLFIPKGEEITKQYTSPLEVTNIRYVRALDSHLIAEMDSSSTI